MRNDSWQLLNINTSCSFLVRTFRISCSILQKWKLSYANAAAVVIVCICSAATNCQNGRYTFILHCTDLGISEPSPPQVRKSKHQFRSNCLMQDYKRRWWYVLVRTSTMFDSSACGKLRILLVTHSVKLSISWPGFTITYLPVLVLNGKSRVRAALSHKRTIFFISRPKPAGVRSKVRNSQEKKRNYLAWNRKNYKIYSITSSWFVLQLFCVWLYKPAIVAM